MKSFIFIVLMMLAQCLVAYSANQNLINLSKAVSPTEVSLQPYLKLPTIVNYANISISTSANVINKIKRALQNNEIILLDFSQSLNYKQQQEKVLLSTLGVSFHSHNHRLMLIWKAHQQFYIESISTATQTTAMLAKKINHELKKIQRQQQVKDPNVQVNGYVINIVFNDNNLKCSIDNHDYCTDDNGNDVGSVNYTEQITLARSNGAGGTVNAKYAIFKIIPNTGVVLTTRDRHAWQANRDPIATQYEFYVKPTAGVKLPPELVLESYAPENQIHDTTYSSSYSLSISGEITGGSGAGKMFLEGQGSQTWSSQYTVTVPEYSYVTNEVDNSPTGIAFSALLDGVEPGTNFNPKNVTNIAYNDMQPVGIVTYRVKPSETGSTTFQLGYDVQVGHHIGGNNFKLTPWKNSNSITIDWNKPYFLPIVPIKVTHNLLINSRLETDCLTVDHIGNTEPDKIQANTLVHPQQCVVNSDAGQQAFQAWGYDGRYDQLVYLYKPSLCLAFDIDGNINRLGLVDCKTYAANKTIQWHYSTDQKNNPQDGYFFSTYWQDGTSGFYHVVNETVDGKNFTITNYDLAKNNRWFLYAYQGGYQLITKNSFQINNKSNT